MSLEHNHTIFVTTREAIAVVVLLLVLYLAIAISGPWIGYRAGLRASAIQCPDVAISQVNNENGEVVCILKVERSPSAVFKHHVIRKGI